MKNALLIAALTLTSASAFASKARMEALQSSKQLVDTQTIFNNPAHIMSLPDHVSVEFGAASNTSSGNSAGTAEGGFFRSWDDMKWGMYFGRKSEFTAGYRNNPFAVNSAITATSTGSKLLFGSAAGVNVFQGQDNPLELFWGMKGDISYAASISYSDSKVTRQVGAGATDIAEATQQAMGIRLGAKADVWDVYANVGLSSKATTRSETAFSGLGDRSAEYKGDTSFKVGGSYSMDTMYFHLTYVSDGAKIDETTSSVTANQEGNKKSGQVVTLGAINQNSFEGGQFFYGLSLVNTTAKHEIIDRANVATQDVEYKMTSMALPVLAGVEYDATTWLTVRGAVSQNLPFSTGKVDTTNGTLPTVSTHANNTTNTNVTAGVGMKFGKLSFDGFLRGSNNNNGQFGSDDNFLTHGSVTYLF